MNSSRAKLHELITIGILVVAVYMIFLDISIVFVALPSLERGTGATFSEAEFVVAGYQLAYASLLFCGGHLGDLLGRRYAFVLGLFIFGGASAACGFAPNSSVLDVARVIQGAGAGIVYPQMIPVLHSISDEGARRRGIAAVTASMGAGIVTGPLVGGALIAAGLGGIHNAWRPIFLVNVPMALVAALVALKALPKRVGTSFQGFDFIGLGLMSLSVFLVVFPLVEAPDHGVGLTSCLSFAAGALSAGLLVLRNRKRSQAVQSVLFKWHLFRDRAFALGTAVTFVLFLGIPSFFFLMTLFMQFGLGFSAIRAGVTAVPYALGTIVAAGASPAILKKVGKLSIYVGCALLISGMYSISRLVTSMAPLSSGRSLWLPLLVCGLGVGSAGVPLLNVIIAAMREGEAGGASGLVTTAQQVAGATGVAVVGMLMFGIFASNAASTVDSQVPALGHQLETSGVSATLMPEVISSYRNCISQAARSKDPVNLPAICKALNGSKGTHTLAGRIEATLTRYGDEARLHDFSFVVSRVLLFNIGVFVLALVMSLLLPEPNRDLISAEMLD